MQRRYRLVHSRRFQQVYREGRTLVHPLLVMRALANNLAYSHFGFVVSKRIGHAVVRNRVRRVMREAVRARIAQLPPRWDLVLIARAPIVRASFWRIGEALDRLLLDVGEAHISRLDPRQNSHSSKI